VKHRTGLIEKTWRHFNNLHGLKIANSEDLCNFIESNSKIFVLNFTKMRATTQTKGLDRVREILPKPRVKSLMELSQEIPDGKYAGLSKLLEPHESPKNKHK
jgi:hypothetical protein